ncbi:MAG: DoxX family protein [Pedobacter sp.]|nr:DoxX family protein [Pedobacter sp.]
MKKTKIIYWVSTVMFSLFMAATAVPDVLMSPDAVKFMHQLGYPDYFTSFIGVAKLLGAVALVIPSYYRIKEWAYAGLFFDLVGAVYSVGCSMGIDLSMLFMVLPFTLGTLSYLYYHKLYGKGQ